MDDAISKFMAKNGKKGGKSGKGDSKRRGDSEYYRTIAKKRKKKTTP